MPTPHSVRRFALYAWSVLAYNIAVVLWGAFVRATGAGAGCGKHWPLCNGEMLPRSPSLNTIVEFTHRVTSGIDLLLVALLVFWAFRAFPPRHAVRLGALLSAAFRPPFCSPKRCSARPLCNWSTSPGIRRRRALTR